MWKNYFSASSLEEVIQILAEDGEKVRIVAGATDLLLEIERGVRVGIETLVDVTRIPGLDKIVLDEQEWIHLGPLVTHNDCVASTLIVEYGFPLAQAAWEVGAPQIRNRGTVAGNLITASPANDTITPLMALGAQVTLLSIRGERVVPLERFYTGVRGTVMEADEMLVDIAFPGMTQGQYGMFIKLGLRRAQAISIVNAAVVLRLAKGDSVRQRLRVERVSITLGAVAPTILHAEKAEQYLIGRKLSDESISHAAELAMQEAKPIDDVRSPADYRREMVRVCVSRALHGITQGKEGDGFPEEPVLLALRNKNGRDHSHREGLMHRQGTPIVTRINGHEHTFSTGQDKTLLRLLREEAQLTGTKEGCAEGECGACTVFLDGMAVMSCLVPAVRAHGSEIVTIEGLAKDGVLHPMQRAFVDAGAVQCGYCTPGFIMSGAILLEEQPAPTKEQVQQAITGNLCRCTGYYKIIEAIERASQ